jgi:hypothetical protein
MSCTTAAAVLGCAAVVAAVLAGQFHRVLGSEGYMDEIFHIPQVRGSFGVRGLKLEMMEVHACHEKQHTSNSIAPLAACVSDVCFNQSLISTLSPA